MNSSSPVLARVEGAVATLTLSRPERLNAIDDALADALREAIVSVESQAPVRVIVLRGAGRAFCAGGDVAAMAASGAGLPCFIESTIDAFHAALRTLRRSRLPVICGVHGAAAGGGFSLALCADVLIAARSARFVTAYPKLGATADGGISFHLTRRLGVLRAFEILTSADTIDAERAMALGLANQVVDDDQLDATASQWVERLLALTPMSLQGIKRLVVDASADDFDAQLAREKSAFMACVATPEFIDRVATFAAGAAVRRP